MSMRNRNIVIKKSRYNLPPLVKPILGFPKKGQTTPSYSASTSRAFELIEFIVQRLEA